MAVDAGVVALDGQDIDSVAQVFFEILEWKIRMLGGVVVFDRAENS